MQATYIDTADQAKMIRAALKNSFPSVKFSVRLQRYAGGSSIDVKWTDGPTTKMVEQILQPFRGGGFDGSIDLAYSAKSWLLPDGSVVFASTEGTAGSTGSVEPLRTWMPVPGAKLVQFSAKYVFATRELSPAFEAQLFARLARKGIKQAEGITSRRAAFNVMVPELGQGLINLANIEASRLVIARGAA